MGEPSDVIDRVSPPADLAPLVEALAGRTARISRVRFPVFPTARAELIFHFGDPFLIADAPTGPTRPLTPVALLGPRRALYWQVAGPRIDWFLIQLTPLGVRRLLGVSFAEAWHCEIDLAALRGGRFDALHDHLRGVASFQARAAIAVATLRSLQLRVDDDPVSCAGSLARAGRIRSLAQFGARLDVSPRRLHQRFVTDYGIGPKYFLSLMHFGRQLAGRHPMADARAQADEPEYADDSHAIREFRRFAGLTPSAYVRQKQGDHLIFTGAAQPSG